MVITIDGKDCRCQPGETLLDIAARNQITIPVLCHHEGFPGQGCCRVCLVEVETAGRSDIVTACVYPVERECTVYTSSESVSQHRAMVLSMLRCLAPESQEVSRLCDEYGATEHERFIRNDGGKCILCGLCVKACESLGTGAIWTMNRGVEKVVATPYDEPSLVCVGCASCASTCPVGAIDVVETETERTIWNKTFKLKACAKCGMIMGTYFELGRAAVKAEADVPDLCESCRKKAVAGVMAATYGV